MLKDFLSHCRTFNLKKDWRLNSSVELKGGSVVEEFMREFYLDQTQDLATLSIITIKKESLKDSSTDYFDNIFLVLKENTEKTWEINHYEYKELKIAVHIVSIAQIHEWLSRSSNRRAVSWLINGEIIYDMDGYMKKFREKLICFPEGERKERICIEFSRLVRRFADGKSFYYEGNYLDSFNQIVHALHHLARLAVIEKGLYPEVLVWEQVKQVEPEIHKLYSELVTGSEPIEKRLELLLLANEFELTTKIKLGSAHLLSVMSEQSQAWKVDDLKEKVAFHDFSLDVSLLLEYLTGKGLIDIKLEKIQGSCMTHRKYLVNKYPHQAASQ